MTHDEAIVVWAAIIYLAVWNVALTCGFARHHDLIDRLDAVLSQALTALGFPKKG
jgi:hypothetical protein